MTRVLRRIFAAVLAASLLLPMFAVSPAAASCTGAEFKYWESPNYTADDTYFQPAGFGDRCYSSGGVPDLRAQFVGTPTDVDCANPLIAHRRNFDDCISSWKFIGNCHYGIRIYEDYNYTGTLLWNRWGSVNFSGGITWEDKVSSFKFQYRTTCPASPIE